MPFLWETTTVKFCACVQSSCQIIWELDRIRVGLQLEKSLLIKINFPPGPGSKWENFTNNDAFQLELKSFIYHLDQGPDCKFSLKMTKYFYLKIKKWKFDRDFFGGFSSQIIWQLDRGLTAKLYGITQQINKI